MKLSHFQKAGAGVLMLSAIQFVHASAEGQPQIGLGRSCSIDEQCTSGHCEAAWSSQHKFCTSYAQGCSVPIPGNRGLRAEGRKSMGPFPSGVPMSSGRYVCTQRRGQGDYTLIAEKSKGEQCSVSPQCVVGTVCSLKNYYKRSNGEIRAFSERRYCKPLDECLSPTSSTTFPLGTMRFQDGIAYKCVPGETSLADSTGAYWRERLPNGKKAGSPKDGFPSVYETPGFGNYAAEDLSQICRSGRVGRWTQTKHYYCLSRSKACAYPNTSGKNAAHKVTQGGVDYRCAPWPHGWRREDGEVCTESDECGVLSQCRSGPGGKYCKSNFKKCAWPNTAGLQAGQTRTHNGRRYRCESNGALTNLGPAD